jgi:hypothetical protein
MSAGLYTFEYNGTTGEADDGYSAGVTDLNIFYEVCQDVSYAFGAQPSCGYETCYRDVGLYLCAMRHKSVGRINGSIFPVSNVLLTCFFLIIRAATLRGS